MPEWIAELALGAALEKADKAEWTPQAVQELLRAQPKAAEAKCMHDGKQRTVLAEVLAQLDSGVVQDAAGAEELLAAFPQAAAARFRGQLPLHHVLTFGHADGPPLDLALALLEAYPEAAGEPMRWDDEPELTLLPLHTVVSWAPTKQDPGGKLAQALLAAEPQACVRAGSGYGLYHDVLPVHMCFMSEHLCPVYLRMLLMANASCVRQKDGSGKLALHTACEVFIDTIMDPDYSQEKYPGGPPLADKSAVVELVLQNFPAAAAQPDVDGRLPLHYLAECVSTRKGFVNAVDAVLKAYPPAVSIKDMLDQTPLTLVQSKLDSPERQCILAAGGDHAALEKRCEVLERRVAIAQTKARQLAEQGDKRKALEQLKLKNVAMQELASLIAGVGKIGVDAD